MIMTQWGAPTIFATSQAPHFIKIYHRSMPNAYNQLLTCAGANPIKFLQEIIIQKIADLNKLVGIDRIQVPATFSDPTTAKPSYPPLPCFLTRPLTGLLSLSLPCASLMLKTQIGFMNLYLKYLLKFVQELMRDLTDFVMLNIIGIHFFACNIGWMWGTLICG